MPITGNMIIGSRTVRGQAGTLHAFDLALGLWRLIDGDLTKA